MRISLSIDTTIATSPPPSAQLRRQLLNSFHTLFINFSFSVPRHNIAKKYHHNYSNAQRYLPDTRHFSNSGAESLYLIIDQEKRLKYTFP